MNIHKKEEPLNLENCFMEMKKALYWRFINVIISVYYLLIHE